MRQTFFPYYAKKFFVNLFLFLLVNGFAVGQEIYQLPVKNYDETKVPRGRLVLVKEINSDYDDKILLATPTSITADNEGAFYAYDSKLKRISKFDKKFAFVTSFMSRGRGPGEDSGNDMGFDKIDYSPSGQICVCDVFNNKVIFYSKSGKLFKEVRLDRAARTPFRPVMDRNGNLYIFSHGGGIVDQLSPKMDLIHTYLYDKLNGNFVIYKPGLAKKMPTWILTRSTLINTFYDVAQNNQLIIYLSHPSTLYIFKDKKQVLQKNIFIQTEMEMLRKQGEKEIAIAKKFNRDSTAGYGMFNSLFVDRDDDNYFYMAGNFGKVNIYKFDIKKAELVKIINSKDERLYFVEKRNNYFYGLSDKTGNIVIYKEEVK